MWIPLALAGALARGHIGEVTAAGQTSFLPDDAESTRVVNVLQRGYKGGDDIPVIVVFERRGGSTRAT